MIEKVERNGQVAVLISKGYGAGWSSWDSENAESKLFCSKIVDAVLDGVEPCDLISLADEIYPKSYNGGAADLVVYWVDKGAAFRVSEYDGSESLEIIGEIDHFVA